MSDAEIRVLERTVKGDPGDAVALERLAAARTRAGRGWADEPLAPDLRCSAKERGVYVWTRHGVGLELVRVPGSPAFWVGRYPVTRGEWRVSKEPNKEIREHANSDGRDGHPVVNVTHADAVAFCDWAGLRLPTAAEWTRAALGDETVPCRCDGPGVQPHRFAFGLACPRCRGTGAARPLYPWGNEPPTPERCVAASWVGRRTISGRLLASSGHEIQRTTRPVRDAEGRPARPLGASPFGAMDTVGHVQQWVAGVWGVVYGGSFRATYFADGRVTGPRGDDDTGFRVALSTPESAP